MIKKLKKYALATPIISLMVLMAASAFADIPAGNAITLGVVDDLTNIIADFMITISVVLAVILIVWGGIIVMTAQGSPDRYKTGMTTLKNAAIGIGVIFATGVIIKTVEALIDGSFFN